MPRNQKSLYEVAVSEKTRPKSAVRRTIEVSAGFRCDEAKSSSIALYQSASLRRLNRSSPTSDRVEVVIEARRGQYRAK